MTQVDGRLMCPHDNLLKRRDWNIVLKPGDNPGYLCLACFTFVSVDEMKDHGFEMRTIPDYRIHAIMNEKIRAQGVGHRR